MSRYSVSSLLVEAKPESGAGVFKQPAVPARVAFAITCPSDFSDDVEACLTLLNTFPGLERLEKVSMGSSPTKCKLTVEPKDQHTFSILSSSLKLFLAMVGGFEATASGSAKEIAGSVKSEIMGSLLIREFASLTL